MWQEGSSPSTLETTNPCSGRSKRSWALSSPAVRNLARGGDQHAGTLGRARYPTSPLRSPRAVIRDKRQERRAGIQYSIYLSFLSHSFCDHEPEQAILQNAYDAERAHIASNDILPQSVVQLYNQRSRETWSSEDEVICLSSTQPWSRQICRSSFQLTYIQTVSLLEAKCG